MATDGITPGRYNPDLIPISADGVTDSSYNTETGYLTPDTRPMSDEEFRDLIASSLTCRLTNS